MGLWQLQTIIFALSKIYAIKPFRYYGLAPAQAIKLFLKQVADTQTVPLSFSHHQNSSIPNLTTLRAMEEARVERKTAKTYATFEEAMQHLEDN